MPKMLGISVSAEKFGDDFQSKFNEAMKKAFGKDISVKFEEAESSSPKDEETAAAKLQEVEEEKKEVEKKLAEVEEEKKEIAEKMQEVDEEKKKEVTALRERVRFAEETAALPEGQKKEKQMQILLEEKTEEEKKLLLQEKEEEIEEEKKMQEEKEEEEKKVVTALKQQITVLEEKMGDLEKKEANATQKLSKHESDTRKKDIETFIADGEREGRILPRFKPIVKALMEKADSSKVLKYTDTEGKEVSHNELDLVKEFVKGLPSLVNFMEIAPSGELKVFKDTVKKGDQEIPVVDAELGAEIEVYSKQHNVSYEVAYLDVVKLKGNK